MKEKFILPALEMTFVYSDAHCDTLTEIYDRNMSLWENTLHLDGRRLKQQGCKIQFFAVWTDPKYEPDMAYKRAKNVIHNFYCEMQKNPYAFYLLKNSGDIDAAEKEGRIGALLSIEGGGAIEGSLEKLNILYDAGVRAMTLTWNGTNQIGDGSGSDKQGGLTPFGIDVVKEMNRLGMIVDVSHLSDKGFWDVAKICEGPFIASHSNARSVCHHPRNLTDEQIKMIIEIDGFIGLNLYSRFLSDNDQATIDDILKNAEHILSLGGENVVGIGTDFDGMQLLPSGINDVSDMAKLREAFLKAGYDESLIKKIFYGNLHNTVKRILKN